MRPFAQPLQKTARFLARAVVLGQGRHGADQSIVEAGNVGRTYLLEAAQLNVAGDNRGKSPVVRTPKGADAGYLQLFRVDLWLCGGAHLVVEIGPAKGATGAPAELLLGHERVPIVGRRRESFLDRAWTYPAHQIELRPGLVVGARPARSAERLLSNDRASWLVVDVEIPRRVAERQRCLANCLPVSAEHRARQCVRRGLIHNPERFRPLVVRVDMRGHDGSEDLLAQQPVSRILRFDQGRLDEVPVVTAGNAACDDAGVLAPVIEVFTDLRK